MLLSDFDFDLPESAIALRPAEPRDSARLLVVRGDSLKDHTVADLPGFLRPGDALVFNDTRVILARLAGLRTREGLTAAVEATLHRRLAPDRWAAFMRPGKRLREGPVLLPGEKGHRQVHRRPGEHHSQHEIDRHLRSRTGGATLSTFLPTFFAAA